MHVDLNCDLGEGCPHDAELMALISSANVCCGAHAGGRETALMALTLAKQHGVQVGAHPGFADREHFGRRELNLSDDEIFQQCRAQVTDLLGWADEVGVRVRYIKPHGALYNMACRDERIADLVVRAAAELGLPLMGLPGSRLAAACSGRIPFIAEGFADRGYQSDGSLVPRSSPGAFVKDADEAVRQAGWLLGKQGVKTLCVHGDNPQAVAFVRALREALLRQGFAVRAFEVS